MTIALTRSRAAPDRAATDLARRVAEPRPVAEVLGLPPRRLTTGRARPDRTPAAILDINPDRDRPDRALVAAFGERACLRHRVLPWRRLGGQVVVLSCSSDTFDALHDALVATLGPVRLALCSTDQMDRTLARDCAQGLQALAETRTPARDSCRNWDPSRARVLGLAALCAGAACAITWPALTFAALCGWAILTLVLNVGFKVAAAAIFLRQRSRSIPSVTPHPLRGWPARADHLPTVTILVALYKEPDIATDLVRRLARLEYPADRLDICLVVEEADDVTRATLARTPLPAQMRPIVVPRGTLQTKPRALNYALSFARGSIVGVYDAEDAPAPTQVMQVVNRFAEADDRLACLQGRLDFYNSGTNWLSRCFTLEYAAWFRMILPALQHLRLPIPLGGTTLFLRRDILEAIGGWDAHNVTEDADLGLRLARCGYRTEVIDTVTEEEANARAWPWIKQRSRWLKGYAVTYAVHMRSPRRLWADLGASGFFGVQLLFLGTLSQFVLAPLLWSFWLIALGLPHPLTDVVTAPVAITLTVIFLSAEAIGLTVSVLAVRATGKPELVKWAPTLHLYFPLAAVAAYKGLAELAFRPFYWDKTAHGIFGPTGRRGRRARVRMPLPPLRRPDAAE